MPASCLSSLEPTVEPHDAITTNVSSWPIKFHVFCDGQVLKSFENSPGELVMDVELLDTFDDEADQGYYEDETPNLEELQQIMADTGRFTTSSFERLPGQVRLPSEESSSATSSPAGVPGELGNELER